MARVNMEMQVNTEGSTTKLRFFLNQEGGMELLQF